MQTAIVAQQKGRQIIESPVVLPQKKRKLGIPMGNAGEYFVMGELLRRGYDAQLADRNTKGYDLLVGKAEDTKLSKVQIKTVRSGVWYVQASSFVGELADQITIYVLIGPEGGQNPVRYFIARNSDLAAHVHQPSGWQTNAFISTKAVAPFENCWGTLFRQSLNSKA